MKTVSLVLLLLYSMFSNCAKEQNLITRVHCSKNSIHLILNSNLKKKNYVLKDFFVEYFDDNMDCTHLDYSIITMPAIMNLITLIWASGETYWRLVG